MFKFKVIVKPIEDETEPGAFAGIRCDHDFEEWTSQGNEVYTVTADHDIENELWFSDGVVSYEKLLAIPEAWAPYVFAAEPDGFVTNLNGMYRFTTSSEAELREIALAGVMKQICLDSNRDDYRQKIWFHIAQWIRGGGALSDISDDWAVSIFKSEQGD